MSYQLLSQTRPKARNNYPCLWCPEAIPMGTIHVHTVGRGDEFQDDRFHSECFDAMQEFFRENPHEDLIFPRESKRGSATEHA